MQSEGENQERENTGIQEIEEPTWNSSEGRIQEESLQWAGSQSQTEQEDEALWKRGLQDKGKMANYQM